MKVTRINGQPYSEDLVNAISSENHQTLMRSREISSREPFLYDALTRDIEILFEKDGGETGLRLPLQTNYTSVSNLTNYDGNIKWAPLKNWKFGKITDISSKQFKEFLDEMQDRHFIDYAQLFQTYSLFQDSNCDIEGDRGKYLEGPRKKIHTLDSKAQVLEKFVSFPKRKFAINSSSDVRVEKRLAKDKIETYEASLNIQVYTGLSGAPGLEDTFSQTLRIRIKD